MKLRALTLIVVFFIVGQAFGQMTIPIDQSLIPPDGFGPTRTIVKLDPISRVAIGSVPFDRTFIVRIYFDPQTANPDLTDKGVKYFFLVTASKTGPVYRQLGFYLVNSIATATVKTADYDGTDTFLKVFPNAIDVVVPALSPNQEFKLIYVKNSSQLQINQYISVLKLFYGNNEQTGINNENSYRAANGNDLQIPPGEQLRDYYNQHPELKAIFDKYKGDASKATADLTGFMLTNNTCKAPNGTIGILFTNTQRAAVLNTSQFNLATNAPLQVIADGGLIFTGFQKGFNTVTYYVGLNIAFRPMDSDIPFKTLVKSRHIKWTQRLTANIGVTLNSIAKTNYRANLFGNDNVIAGLGYKFSHVINMSFGGMIYNNVNPNPLLDKKTIGVAPYVGLSINLKIKDALGEIAKVFQYGK